MDKAKRKRLEAKGWRVGTAAEFLGFTPEESAYVELKVALGSKLKDLRNRKRLSQVELAKRIGSSQSRVAKIEAADPSVSLDLLVRSLIALGATRKDLARVIASPNPSASSVAFCNVTYVATSRITDVATSRIMVAGLVYASIALITQFRSARW